MSRLQLVTTILLVTISAVRTSASSLYDSLIVAKKDTFTVAITYRMVFDDPHEIPRLSFFDSTNTHSYRYRTTNEKSLYTGGLGMIGQASYNLNFQENRSLSGNLFLEPFAQSFWSCNDNAYYNTRRPYTKLSYVDGSKDENIFDVFHTQNVNKETNVGVQMRFYGGEGAYDFQKTSGRQSRAFGSYFGSRYSIVGQLSYNRFFSQENGGLRKISEIRDYSGKQLDVNITEGNSQNRMTQLYVKQELNLSRRYREPDSIQLDIKEFPLSLGTETRYDQTRRNYSENFYGFYRHYYLTKPYDTVRTIDSATYRMLENMVFVKVTGNKKRGPAIMLGYGMKSEKYDFADYSRYYPASYFNSPFVMVKLWVKNPSTWGSNAQLRYFLDGRQKTNYEASSTIFRDVKIANHPARLEARLTSELASPSFFASTYSSNFYRWNKQLDAELTNRCQVSLTSHKRVFEVKVSSSIYSKHVYFNQDIVPTQATGSVIVYSASASKTTMFSVFLLENNIMWQQSSSQIISVPQLATYNTVALNVKTFKKKLKIKTGVDIYYWTSFFAPDYSPELGVFYNQRTNRYGDYPYVDVFTQLNFKRMQVFFKYAHASYLFTSSNEFVTVKNYPVQKSNFAFGISWYFYN